MLVRPFLEAVDTAWAPLNEKKTTLFILGSSALFLQADYHRGTKDSDILKTDELPKNVCEQLIELAGPNTSLHQRYHLYIDIVGCGIPFLSQQPVWQNVDIKLRHFEVKALDICDVLVSKLKPFRASDRSDIAAMVERDLVDHKQFVGRFKAAVDWFTMDARANSLPEYVENLHEVERDIFSVEETPIELPSWV